MNFHVYFIFVNQFVNFAYASVSDEATFQNLEIIYNFEDECRPNLDQNLNTCPWKVWLVAAGMRLFNHSGISWNAHEISDCFKQCFNEPTCIAITRTHYHPNICWIFNKKDDFGIDNNYKTFFLKCCKIKKKETEELNEPNYPVVFWMDEMVEFEPYTGKKKCKNFVWQLKEKHDIANTFLYKSFQLKNTIDCMNECAKNKSCTAIKTFIDEFNPMCHLYKETNRVSTMNVPRINAYLLYCAKIKDSVLHKKEALGGLPMLYEPTKHCKTFLTRYKIFSTRECRGKIWHVEDGVRWKNHYKKKNSEHVGFCLNQCGGDQKCEAVSYDRITLNCLYFKKDDLSIHYRQFHWTTYTLSCCDEFKNDNAYQGYLLQTTEETKKETKMVTKKETKMVTKKETKMVTTKETTKETKKETTKETTKETKKEQNEKKQVETIQKPSNLIKTGYPLISNITEDCLPEENPNIQKCESKAWLVVNNLRIKQNTDKLETNLLSCFEQCLKSTDCKVVMEQKSKKENCWISNEQSLNEINNEYKSFFLTCCVLKEKREIDKNKKNQLLSSDKEPTKKSSAEFIKFPRKEYFLLLMMLVHLVGVMHDETLF